MKIGLELITNFSSKSLKSGISVSGFQLGGKTEYSIHPKAGHGSAFEFILMPVPTI
jgi:hypothetical protein